MDDQKLTAETVRDITAVSADDWDRLAGSANPFVSHAFLAALESGGAVGGDSGWDPFHIIVRDGNGRLAAAMPLYVKHHSYGEYVFDHSWANAFERAGGRYYPKLLSAIPFTPVTGPRLLAQDASAALKCALADAVLALVQQYQISSAHINFVAPSDAQLLQQQGWLVRQGLQFHWHNANYADFDAFLASLSSRKRKNIRKERAGVMAAGVTMRQLTGDAISPDHIDAFYRFYLSTIDRKWGGAYLTLPVFQQLRKTMANKMLLVVAEYDGRIIGGALNFIGEDTLYGRNWGADIDIPFLHFEACYYQAIDYAIRHGLARVEAGAQGFHKVQRGYLPETTWSLHHLADEGFRAAVARFLDAESHGISDEKNQIAMTTPFRSAR
jgi:predicted N-acyltransferase